VLLDIEKKHHKSYKSFLFPISMKKCNLDKLNAKVMSDVDDALRGYSAYFGGEFGFGKPEKFKLASDKGYCAKTTANILRNTNYIGKDITILLMEKYDGTGEISEMHNLRNTFIPQPFIHAQTIAMPRNKDKTIKELILPLGSINNDGFIPYASCLDELTIAPTSQKPYDGQIATGWHLGESEERYAQIINWKKEAKKSEAREEEPALKIKLEPKPQLTVWGNEQERGGDPHSIFYGANFDTQQIVGFIAINNNEYRPLLSLLMQNIEIPPVDERIRDRKAS
jgi:hypothetical protein